MATALLTTSAGSILNCIRKLAMNRRRSSVAVQAGRAHDSKRLPICGSVRITWSASLVPRAMIETRSLFDRYFRIFRAARSSLFAGRTRQKRVYFVDREQAGLQFRKLTQRV